MPANFTYTTIVRIDGLAGEWVLSSDSFVKVEDEKFVPITARACNSLKSLLLTGNAAAPNPVPKNFGITTWSVGLADIMRRRDEQHSRELASEVAAAPGEELFGKQQETKRRRTSRSELKELREKRKLIQVSIPPFAGRDAGMLRVLRPVCARDVVTVEFTPQAIELLVMYIRYSGFSEPVRFQRDPDRPRGSGLWRKGVDKVLAVTQDGRRRLYSAQEIDMVCPNPDGHENGCEPEEELEYEEEEAEPEGAAVVPSTSASSSTMSTPFSFQSWLKQEP